LCCKYPSPVKRHALLPLLDQYPDKRKANILREGFSFGFKLGYLGERKQRDAPNLKSVLEEPQRALEKLGKEIKCKRLAGPFSSRPISDLIISPIGLVPKSEPGKWRLIHHLSYPEGSSVNDGIDRGFCVVKYESFDTAVRLVVPVGRGALMAKADIESAFRLLPVHPDDFQLLGMQVLDQYFVDKALPMGASCSPALFETFSTFLEWAAKKKAGSDMITHYADDFFFAGVSDEQSNLSCAKLVARFEQLCQELGVPLAKEKSVGPSTKIVYLGLEIDSIRQVIAIPGKKLADIKAKVKRALQAASLTLREVQSVVGSLSFVCKAISPGRAFLRRLIALTSGKLKSWEKVTLTQGAKRDLQMWVLFLDHFNGTAIIPDQAWADEVDLSLFTDASSQTGFGGFYGGRWFQGRWPSAKFKSYSIAWQEFFPILVAVVVWGELLRGKKIIIRSDNKAVVAIVNKQTSRCPTIMKLVRFFVLQCLKLNITFCARHIAGKNNNVADALSRFQMGRFREAAPTADVEPTTVPTFLWNL